MPTVPGTGAEKTFEAGKKSDIHHAMYNACKKGHYMPGVDHPYSLENMEKKASGPVGKAPKS